MDKLLDISEYVPYGAANAISRHDLLEVVRSVFGDISDREMRRMLEYSRQNGNIIINFQNGKGYFRPDCKEEIVKYIQQEEARAKTIHFNLKSAKKALRVLEGQLTIDEI